MNFGFENDRTLLRLYEIKKRSHDLNNEEQKEFSRLERLYSISNSSFLSEIDPVLSSKEFIVDINISRYEETPDGGTTTIRYDDKREYRITDLGNEALRNHTFDSESKRRKIAERDRTTTRIIAYLALLISALTFFLEIVKILINE